MPGFPDIIGADRGFNVGADAVTNTADGVSLASVYEEFQTALAEWNRSRNVISQLFTFDTTDSFAQIAKDPNSGEDFEEASEFGIPQAARISPGYERIGFPLKWYDSRAAFTRKFLRDATYEQLTTLHADRIEADNRLLFRSTLSAVTSINPVASRKTNENGVPILDLWDGSNGEIPPAFGGKTFTADHSHYLVSGAATVDGGDLKALIDTIQEHGWGLRESSETVVLMVRKGSTTAEAIRTFRADPENLAKNPYDFIPSVAAPAYLTDQLIVGDKAPESWQGLPIFGSYGDALLFESYWIPDGYVLALATSGAGSSRNPVAFRQHTRTEHRGLRMVSDTSNSNYPLINSYYERGFGVGIRNRSAAAVMQIKASGSYVSPVWP